MGFRLDNESSIVPEANLEFHNSKFRGPKNFEFFFRAFLISLCTIFLVKVRSRSNPMIVFFLKVFLTVCPENSANRELAFSSPRTIYLVKNSQTFTEDAKVSEEHFI